MSGVFDIDVLLSLQTGLGKTVGLYEKVDILIKRIRCFEIKDFSFREVFWGFFVVFFFVRSININSISNG